MVYIHWKPTPNYPSTVGLKLWDRQSPKGQAPLRKEEPPRYAIFSQVQVLSRFMPFWKAFTGLSTKVIMLCKSFQWMPIDTSQNPIWINVWLTLKSTSNNCNHKLHFFHTIIKKLRFCGDKFINIPALEYIERLRTPATLQDIVMLCHD